jgi:hypothetical protein
MISLVFVIGVSADSTEGGNGGGDSFIGVTLQNGAKGSTDYNPNHNVSH